MILIDHINRRVLKKLLSEKFQAGVELTVQNTLNTAYGLDLTSTSAEWAVHQLILEVKSNGDMKKLSALAEQLETIASLERLPDTTRHSINRLRELCASTEKRSDILHLQWIEESLEECISIKRRMDRERRASLVFFVISLCVLAMGIYGRLGYPSTEEIRDALADEIRKNPDSQQNFKIDPAPSSR
ncbi:hypothetical protein [Acidovorax sp. SUPP3334]|uniref:hypothetical protein n=1 Tax=Acidovorax sp. SUPP3334 TaxID=2920881 RepID=UPI0023DE2591|nr:hypothetical protein [Acidovorax sp. SUPP3334]GKT25143.1 hypothetical protein AVHM3334_17035 [Acidovorax sp. SUPP3334]